MQRALIDMNLSKSRARINNEPDRKETRTMYTPLYVLEAHIDAVDTKRFQQARQAELMRLARQGQQGPVNRFIAAIRRSSGSALVSVGQWLQQTPADRVAQELEAMGVTRTQATSSSR
jgi:5-enolpyruvylshikimate-3-phosphate synthase